MNTRNTLVVILYASLLGACVDRSEVFEAPLDVLPPVALDEALMFVDRGNHGVHAVRVSDNDIQTRRYSVGVEPVVAVAHNGSDGLLVLSQGERGRMGHDPEASSIALVRDGASRPVKTYELGSPFNALAQSDDGHFAVAYFRAQEGLDRLLYNPNEIAVIDLETTDVESAVTLRTVRSFGGVPAGVVFSLPMEIAEASARTLAVVTSGAYVTLLDMDHPERSEITVRLTLEGDEREVEPSQILFDTENPTIYVRCDASNDIYVLTLTALAADDIVSNDFRPTMNQLAAGRQPADMALFDTPNGRRLLVVSAGSSDVSVIDATANRVLTISLDAAADRIILFEGAAPADPETKLRALLLRVGGRVEWASFVDLDLIEERQGRNVETVRLGGAVAAYTPLLDRGLLLFVHPQADGGMSLLDLERRTTSPIYAELSLERARFGSEDQRLWVAPPSGERLGWLDLTTFHPGEVRLDASIDDVFAVRSEEGDERVLALHPGEGGYLTVLDAAEPERATAFSKTGFLLNHYLERGE